MLPQPAGEQAKAQLKDMAEQMAFAWAYLIASAVDIAMVAWYAGTTIRRLLGWLTGLLLAGVHLYLYVLLQMEQTALLIGSGMLFGVLATVMILTRNVDWYELFDGLRAASAPPPRADPRSAGLQDG